jgi:hypothetical protein
VVGAKSNAAVVEVASQFEQFQGYSTHRGPLLDLQVLATTIELGADEVLLFGSKEQRQVQQIDQRARMCLLFRHLDDCSLNDVLKQTTSDTSG